jgi:hypothetical protein
MHGYRFLHPTARGAEKAIKEELEDSLDELAAGPIHVHNPKILGVEKGMMTSHQDPVYVICIYTAYIFIVMLNLGV